MNVRIPYHALFTNLFTASLKLRLDQANRLGAIPHKELGYRQNQFQRNKRYIYADKINWVGNLLFRGVADICPL